MAMYLFSKESILCILYFILGLCCDLLFFNAAYYNNKSLGLAALIMLLTAFMCAAETKKVFRGLNVLFVLFMHAIIAWFSTEAMGMQLNIIGVVNFLIIFVGGMRLTTIARKHGSTIF